MNRVFLLKWNSDSLHISACRKDGTLRMVASDSPWKTILKTNSRFKIMKSPTRRITSDFNLPLMPPLSLNWLTTHWNALCLGACLWGLSAAVYKMPWAWAKFHLFYKLRYVMNRCSTSEEIYSTSPPARLFFEFLLKHTDSHKKGFIKAKIYFQS